MKQAAIVVLVCVNIVLALCVVTTSLQRAKAQTFRGASNYILVTGLIDDNLDALYVIDLAKRRLAGWRFDARKNRFTPLTGRNLSNDFGKK